MRRYNVIFGLIVVGAIAGISFYQPPMRLMPAPALFLDGQKSTFSGAPETTDPQIFLFYATNRLPIGPRDNRIYTVVPGRDLNLGVATIRIGNENTTWERIYEWSTRASGDRRPFLYLQSMVEQASLADANPLPAEASAWFAQINDALGAATRTSSSTSTAPIR